MIHLHGYRLLKSFDMRLVSVSQHRRLEEPNLSEATGGNDSEGMVLDVDEGISLELRMGSRYRENER